MKNAGIILVVVLTTSMLLVAKEYYVGPGGIDTNPGTLSEPFKTIEGASKILGPGDTCYIREGIYKETLTPRVSGEPGKEIVYSSYNNENVTISALESIDGWEKDGQIYSAPMDWTLGSKNQIFYNMEMLHEATWPNLGRDPLFKPERAIVENGDVGYIINSKIPGGPSDWKGAEIWCKGGSGWISWTGEVTEYSPDSNTLNFEIDYYTGPHYRPKMGNLFVLRGVRKALDTPGEWFFDSDRKRLYLIPPTVGELVNIEAKKRETAIDLRDRSHIVIENISFIGGDIKTSSSSSYITLDRLKGSYISHSYFEDNSWESGVKIYGDNNLVVNCDFGYSSGSVLMVKGNSNRVINNDLHHGNYAGLWVGAVDLSGRKHIFSHNTVKISGRDTIAVTGLMESIVQYNDISEAGYLTNDLGLIYGQNTDFANSVFQYNWLHDNRSPNIGPGFHIDIANYNIIIRNNIIWNVPDAPISVNHPSQSSIVYNNSSLNSGAVTTFGWFDTTKQISSRYCNNIFNDEMRVSVYNRNNLIWEKPLYRDPENRDFRLKIKKKVGAFANSEKLWRAGCDLKNPPNPLPTYKTPDIPWMNKAYNGSFEFGNLEGWNKTGSKKAKLSEGNIWGNNWGSEDLHPTATNNFELELGPGSNGIEQKITNLQPNTKYTLSGWLRTSTRKSRIVLGVKSYGGEEKSKSSTSVKWKRKVIKFKTGPNSRSATIYINKSGGESVAWCDNILLPMTSY